MPTVMLKHQMNSKVDQLPHRRKNPLTGEYVLVSPHRSQRPWLGHIDEPGVEPLPPYDPDCYLCPGNERAGGEKNPEYAATFIFTNDFQALIPDPMDQETEPKSPEFFQRDPIRGTCRVVCFSPRHDLTLPEMESDEILSVIQVWMAQTAELGEVYQWVQVFQNKGSLMGASNPHPHGQIWASDGLPNEPMNEDRNQRLYFENNGSQLLLDYVNAELESDQRIILQNDNWIVVVPFWAIWPFETLLLPRQHRLRITDINKTEQRDLAVILKGLLTRYDNLFKTSFPYSMGWHGAPFNGEENEHWQLHAHFYPPLLRSASVRKFMVGYEMLGEPQRDLTPEAAAERLKSLPAIHYKQTEGK